jgi:hypothetical protein
MKLFTLQHLTVLLLLATSAVNTITQWPIVDGFVPPQNGVIFADADLELKAPAASADECAARCKAYTGSSWNSLGCISFNLCGAAPPYECGFQGYNRTLTLKTSSGTCALFQRILPRNDSHISQQVPWLLSRPPPRSVRLLGGPLFDMFSANVGFLLSFSVENLLYNFRRRAGIPTGNATCVGWDCHPDWVEGSLAAQFLMGAGNHLLWDEEPRLRAAMDALLIGIAACAEPNGYILAFPEAKLATSEHPNYVLSWTVHGLLAAHAAGSSIALPMARKMMNIFNNHTLLPTFLPPDGGTPPYQTPAGPPPPMWDGVNRSGFGNQTGHTIYLIKQGIIHNTQMALSAVGTQADVDLVKRVYQENWWLEFLASGDSASIWQRQWFSHNYEVTAFEAYLDMYVLTGEQAYLDSVFSAWRMYRESFIHVGGSAAINENFYYPPQSYYLTANSSDHSKNVKNHATGELCGGVFWIKLNQRLHFLYPSNESFVGEIETQLVNEAPTHQHEDIGIRHFSILNGYIENATAIGNCCEGQGTRLYGSLNEFLYSIPAPPAPDGVWIDIYAESALNTTTRGGVPVEIIVTTAFPLNGRMNVKVTAEQVCDFDVALRIPSWTANGTVVAIFVNGIVAGSGLPGTYFHVSRTFESQVPTLITFEFLYSLTAHAYAGVTQIPSFTRAAFTFGPVLLAAIGGWDTINEAVVMPSGIDPTQPSAWLQPLGNLSFSVHGSGIQFIPLSLVEDGQLFSVYPLFS